VVFGNPWEQLIVCSATAMLLVFVCACLTLVLRRVISFYLLAARVFVVILFIRVSPDAVFVLFVRRREVVAESALRNM